MLSVLQNQDAAADVADTPAELAIGHSFGFATDDEMFRNFEDRFDVTVLEGYGVTPATIATYNRPSDRRLGSVGTEASYVELEIVDSDDWPVPTGETGEIVVRPTRPNTMMKQYHENPPATREAFRNQWLHTGGIGYKDEGWIPPLHRQQGQLDLPRSGRRTHFVARNRVLSTHSPVCASRRWSASETNRATRRSKRSSFPKTAPILRPSTSVNAASSSSPYLKVPRYIELRDDLPRSPSGKVRKRDLKAEGRPTPGTGRAATNSAANPCRTRYLAALKATVRSSRQRYRRGRVGPCSG